MRRKAVDSSRINSVGWENNVLEVEFKMVRYISTMM